MTRVEVLLATYMSADYLAEFLDSLLAQSHSDFHLVVSDDVSTDETWDILTAYAPRFANPPRLIRRDTPSGSAQANFASLIAQSQADYVFLADHDDIWEPDKIARSLDAMHAAEAAAPGTAILVHSDLSVIDGQGRPQHPSYWAFKGIAPGHGTRLNTALVHATVTGCTALMNAPLLARCKSMPDDAIMHDWFINLVAVLFGQVVPIPQPLIRYRIHGRNASRPRQVSVLASFGQLDRVRRLRHGMRQRARQAALLLDTYGADLSPEDRAVLTRFAALYEVGFVRRKLRLLRGRHFWPGLWRNTVQILAA